MNLRERGDDYAIYGISSIYSLVAKIIFELVDFLCGIGHPFKGFFLLLKSSERLYQCTCSPFRVQRFISWVMSVIQSSPLVRSAFCPMKIDHTNGLTLYPGY